MLIINTSQGKVSFGNVGKDCFFVHANVLYVKVSYSTAGALGTATRIHPDPKDEFYPSGRRLTFSDDIEVKRVTIKDVMVNEAYEAVRQPKTGRELLGGEPRWALSDESLGLYEELDTAYLIYPCTLNIEACSDGRFYVHIENTICDFRTLEEAEGYLANSEFAIGEGYIKP